MLKKSVILCHLLLLSHTGIFAADIETADRQYERGDYKTAFAEYARLAAAGNSRAQYNLAFMYFGGEGIGPDYYQAFYWFEKAAQAGYPRAQDLLGYMYSHGYGVAKDRVRAYVWYALAAANGIFLAAEIRDRLADEMGRAERLQAEILAREYFKKYLQQAD